MVPTKEKMKKTAPARAAREFCRDIVILLFFTSIFIIFIAVFSWRSPAVQSYHYMHVWLAARSQCCSEQLLLSSAAAAAGLLLLLSCCCCCLGLGAAALHCARTHTHMRTHELYAACCCVLRAYCVLLLLTGLLPRCRES